MSTKQKRIKQAMVETARILDKEYSYSEKHQNKKLIAEYEAHMEKLKKMLRE